MKINNLILTVSLILVMFLIAGVYNMIGRIAPLSGELKDVFETEKALTDYAKTHPIDLKNILIKNHDISHTTLLKGSFTNTQWDDVVYQYANISNVIFNGGDLYDVSFARSTLTNVTFENMTMEKVELVGAKLINVTFKNCKIYNSNFGSLKMSKILIENSEMNNVEFFESELDITLKKVNFKKQARFMGLKAGSKVLIEDSFIGSNSTFDHSNILSFTMRNSTVMDSKMNNATVDEIIIEDTKMDFPIADGKINKIQMRAVDQIKLGGSKINSLLIDDCKDNYGVYLYDIIFKSITINNCPTEKMDISDAKGEKLNIRKMDTLNADFSKLVVKELIMNEITINGKADFTGALAEESLITNFSIKKGTQVKMEGTNFKFQ